MKRSQQLGRYFALGIALVFASLLATFFAGRAVELEAERAGKQRFERTVDELTQRTQGSLRSYESLLFAGRGLFLASDAVDVDEWARFVESLDLSERYPGVLGLGYVQWVTADQRDAFTHALQMENGANTQIHPVPDGVAHDGPHLVVRWSEPAFPNRRAVGLDISTEEHRLKTALVAQESGQPRITHAISLVQDTKQRPGFLLLVPIHQGRGNPGFIYAPWVVDELFQNDVFPIPPGVSLELLQQWDKPETIYQHPPLSSEHFASSRTITVFGQDWILRWTADDSFQYSGGLSAAFAIRTIGITTSLGLVLILGLLYRASASALVDAEAASKAKSEFLATITHELRTPLFGILGQIEVWQHENPSPEVGQRLAFLQTSGRLLADIINQVLDYSKITALGVVLDPQPTDVLAELDSVVNGFRASVSPSTTLTYTPELRARWYLVDSVRLKQVAINLLGNAIKFTPSGTIELSVRENGEGVQLQVRDTGIGISEQARSKLFQPFHQGNNSINRKFGGTGLGLSIVAKIVEAHRGRWQLDSTPGQGTTITVTLPLPPCEPPVPQTAARAPTPDALELRVLLCEDNPVNQLLLTAMLEKIGCTVQIARHGGEAVQFAEHGAFDAILMDIHMPVMNGLDATAAIRKNGILTPIFAVSADNETSLTERLPDLGFTGFVAKPTRLVDLTRILEPLAHSRYRGRHA